MKKTLVTLLALVFVLSIGATAFAAPANPFVDVPAKHWAYDAVSKLAKAGLVDGYGDGTFRGDKAMSRYEMAQVVAKAMARSDKADAENKALIDKLAVEFAAELNNLGVRVTALEKKVDNLKFTGDIRAFYEHHSVDILGAKSATASRNIRTRLYLSGQINDEWSYKARIANVQDMNVSGSSAATDYNYAFVQGPIVGADVKFGRFPYFVGYGVVADSYMDGINVGFGSALKVNVFYGKADVKSAPFVYGTETAGKALAATGVLADNTGFAGVELKYAVTKDTTIMAAYHDYKTVNVSDANRIWELGFDTKFNEDWAFYASYAKSNAADQNRGFALGLSYKNIDLSKPGTYQLYANYRNLQAFSTFQSTYDVANISPLENTYAGSKGYELGFYYVPAKNIRWHVEYVDAKGTTNSNIKDKYFMTRVNFFF